VARELFAGLIMEWSGSIGAIPDGWYLCDGTHGTPDLRDRFVVEAGSSYAVGETGGSSSHLQQLQATSHWHQMRAGTSIASGMDLFTFFNNASVSGPVNPAINLPVYFALAYIMYGG
jgi:microcystin-dependent protein